MGQTKDTGGLVKRLSGRVVDGTADAAIAVMRLDDQELTMSAGHQQHQIGERHLIGQPRGQRVPRQMVYPDQRQAGRRRQPLGAHDARQHPANQPRPGGHRDGVQIGETDPCFGHGLFDGMVDLFGMGTCCDFGDDTAKIGMQRGLPINHRRQHIGAAHNGGGGVVAAAFNAKDRQGLGHMCSGCAFVLCR